MTVLVAVSGGADSVALLRGLNAIRKGGAGRLVVGHFNHGWRGAESDADEQFVRQLADCLGLPVEIGRPRAPSASQPLRQEDEKTGTRTELAARQTRYDFLESTAARLGARYVVTAHTADDQVETILQRIIRGTGLAGLTGMRRARPLGPAAALLRPVLGFRRRELLQYLVTLGQDYRQDATNADQEFTRNRIRHELLPLLEQHYYPGVSESLLRLGGLAADAQRVIDERTAEIVEQCVTTEADGLRIDSRTLASQPRHLVREALLAAWRSQGWPLGSMGFEEWESLAGMIVDGHAAPKVFPGGIHVRCEGPDLVFRRPAVKVDEDGR